MKSFFTDAPQFTCAASIGDTVLKVYGGFLTSLQCNIPPPIETTSCMSGGRSFIPSYKKPEMVLHIQGGTYCIEFNKTKRIRDKTVDECNIEELLFAIQYKLKNKF